MGWERGAVSVRPSKFHVCLRLFSSLAWSPSSLLVLLLATETNSSRHSSGGVPSCSFLAPCGPALCFAPDPALLRPHPLVLCLLFCSVCAPVALLWPLCLFAQLSFTAFSVGAPLFVSLVAQGEIFDSLEHPNPVSPSQ